MKKLFLTEKQLHQIINSIVENKQNIINEWEWSDLNPLNWFGGDDEPEPTTTTQSEQPDGPPQYVPAQIEAMRKSLKDGGYLEPNKNYDDAAITRLWKGLGSTTKKISPVETPKPVAPKPNTAVSVVDYLKSVGQPFDFASRRQMAVDLGIVKNPAEYKGTAEQNTTLLTRLKNKAAYSKPITIKQFDAPKLKAGLDPRAGLVSAIARQAQQQDVKDEAPIVGQERQDINKELKQTKRAEIQAAREKYKQEKIPSRRKQRRQAVKNREAGVTKRQARQDWGEGLA